jgi:hypothetical protein
VAKKKLIQLKEREFVDPTPVEHEPNCVRLDTDPDALAQFLLPRLRQARDEASREVLTAYANGRTSIGTAVLDAIESLPPAKTRRLRGWIEEARATRIYAYIDFDPTLDGVSVGLMKTMGGPKDKIISSQEVDSIGLAEDFAHHWDFDDALQRLQEVTADYPPLSTRGGGSLYLTKQLASEARRAEKGRIAHLKNTFDYDEGQSPFVLVENRTQYDRVIAAIGLAPNEGKWTKPGLYDFRDMPPRYYATMAEYHRDLMFTEAEYQLDQMFENDEWQNVCTKLLGQ